MILAMENKFLRLTRRKKVKGALALSELVFYFIGILLIMAVAYMNWPTIRNFFRSGSTWLELQSMQSAATSYMSFHVNGSAPTQVEDLLKGLSATESIDGQEHPKLLSGKTDRWTATGKYVDAWGNEYKITNSGTNNTSTESHEIRSAGPDGTMNTDDDLKVTF